MSFLNENFQFENPWFLLLLLGIPYLLFLFLKKEKLQGQQIRLPGLTSNQYSRNWKIWLRIISPYFYALGLAFMIIALARPQEVLKDEKIEAEGIDIFLTLDLSISMLAKDFEPNRLEASKKVALDFISKRSFDRIGLTIFSGEAFTQCPLTSDHRVLKNFIEKLDISMFDAQGTAIGMGLASALNRLKDSGAKSKVVILLTDGENNAGYIDPKLASEMAKELGIRLYTIGVGTEGVAEGPTGISPNGRIIMGPTKVQLDEELLMYMAKNTGGQYYRATDMSSLQAIYNNINTMEKTVMEVTVIKNKSDMFRPFLLIGMVLILSLTILDQTILRSLN